MRGARLDVDPEPQPSRLVSMKHGPSLNRLARLVPGSQASGVTGAGPARGTGARPIDLAVGEPAEPPPPEVVEAVARAARDCAGRYTPPAGLPELRELVARDQERKSGLERPAEEVLITAGAKPALLDGLRCLLEPGEEAIVLAPCWPIIRQQVAWAGGRSLVIPPRADLLPDVDAIEQACGPRTRVLVLNDPANPTSRTLDRDRLNVVADLARELDLWVVADQVYDDLVLDGEHEPLLRVAPHVRDRILVVESFSMRFAMTGYRLGHACGPPELIAAMTRLVSASSTCANALAQHAGIAALGVPDAWLEAQRERYRERRDLASSALAGMAHLRCERPDAAFYLFPRLLHEEVDDEAFVRALWEREGVRTMPGSAFGAPGHFRISYAVSRADLEEALERIRRFLESWEPDVGVPEVALPPAAHSVEPEQRMFRSPPRA